MATATLRLMQELGVTGPVETLHDFPEDRGEQEVAAKSWADGQIGHPWDTLTVSVEGGDSYEIELS